jgi:hypothetical protein
MIIAAIAFAVVAFFQGIHYQKLKDAAEMGVLNEKARAVEEQRVQEANDHATALKDANDQADKTITKLNADLAAGRVRFSIGAVQPTQAAGAAPRTGAETRCDIDPEAAQSLVAIAADGDKAIRQLNELIDFYNQVRTEK